MIDRKTEGVPRFQIAAAVPASLAEHKAQLTRLLEVRCHAEADVLWPHVEVWITEAGREGPIENGEALDR